MKYLLFCLGFFFLASPSVFASDYFEENIAGADAEIAILQDITLTPILFQDATEARRYDNTASFVASIKIEAEKLFQNGTIPLYRRYDILTSLDSFVYTMNQYFLYQKRYEQTKKATFKENARSYLQDSRGAYDRLKASLKRITY